MADISQVKLPNNTTYDLSVKAEKIKSGYLENRIYLNTQPENSGSAVLPFLYNDLAFLTKKGGSIDAYLTTDTTYTAATLSNRTEYAIASPENMFDGSPSYATNIVRTGTSATDIRVIDLTLHKMFAYSNVFYIDFGSVSWKAAKITVLVKNANTETNYVKKKETTGNTLGHWYGSISHSSTNSSGTTVQGFNRMRIVISGFNDGKPTGNTRIAQIGLINYESFGVKETYMSRGIDDPIFRNVTPNSNNTYDLGSSSEKWANIYATNVSANKVTGQICTSFKNSIAMGSLVASSKTVPDLCEELRYSNGCAGSANITTAYALSGNSTIYAGWYNFLWIPHRSGGNNGESSGDNCNYGSLLLSSMNSQETCFLLKYVNSAITKVVNIVKDTTYSVATTSSNGLMSSSDKTKLNGISSSYDSATETLTINL